ncbi:MAG: hypothetical protein ACTSYS_16710 [Promethearchaeota archaeon]
MGGQESIRGYLFQALISIIDIMDNERQWCKMEIEPDLKSDKVDISWSYWVKNKENQYIIVEELKQIKSSINKYPKNKLIKNLTTLDDILSKSSKNKDNHSKKFSTELVLISPSYDNINLDKFKTKLTWMDINTDFKKICLNKINDFILHHQWKDKRSCYPIFDTELLLNYWIGSLMTNSTDLFHKKMTQHEFKSIFFRKAYVGIESLKDSLNYPIDENEALFNLLEIFIRPGMIISIYSEQITDMLMALEDIKFAIENGILRTRDGLPYSLSFPISEFSPKIQNILSKILVLLEEAKKMRIQFNIKYDKIRIEIWKLVYQLILYLDTEKGKKIKESFSDLTQKTPWSIIRDLEHIDDNNLRKDIKKIK